MTQTPSDLWGTGEPINSVLFAPGSPVFDGAIASMPFGPLTVPAAYHGAREEFMAARESAWFGVMLNTSPVYDVSGPDAVEFLNSVCVNRDFGGLADNGSRHMIICNERGQMLADGLAVKIGDERFRTYWLAPVLDFHLQQTELDVEGTWVLDEYFYQIDGPRSIEIMEAATGADLRDLRFGRNRVVTLGGGPATIHRLGMSGALAYEIHGHSSVALEAYKELRTAVEAAGGLPQGFLNYPIVNHTVAGYPNQSQHYLFPYRESGEALADYFSRGAFFDLGLTGSASGVRQNAYATPYDVGWGFLVDLDHEFPGRDALRVIAGNPPRRAVTLVWNPDDVGAAFTAQLRGDDAVVYDPLTSGVLTIEDYAGLKMRVDYVTDSSGTSLGVTSGRTIDYFANRMISLAFLEADRAVDGSEVTVVWGQPDGPQIKIRATVAGMPAYQGKYRNETFDASARVLSAR